MATANRQCEGCGQQFTFTVKPGTPRRFCTKQCHSVSDKRKATNKKYYATEKYKATQKKYRISDKFEVTRKKYFQSDSTKASLKKLYATDRYKEMRKKNSKTDKRKASNKKYNQSDKGKALLRKHRQSNIGKDTLRKLNQRRRARKRDAFVEDVDVRVLLDLQGGVCFLCSQPISSDIKHPDPMSLSLDHIMPLVNGGLHSYENCAATHLRCNLVKGVKSVEDIAPLLRLVS